MKVIYLTHQYFPRHVGGTEVYARGLARRVTNAGHEAVVVTCHEDPTVAPAHVQVARTEHEGVPVIELSFDLSRMPHPARCEYDNAIVASAMDDLLAEEKPDLVHAMHAMKLSAAALASCYRAGVPVIVTLCDYWFVCPRHTLLDHAGIVCTGPDQPRKCVACMRDLHGFAAAPEVTSPRAWQRYAADLLAIDDRPGFLRRALLGAQRVIALSSFQKGVFVRNGLPTERIDVIPHGLDLEDLQSARDAAEIYAAGPRRIGLAGSLVSHKGAHVLLQALARAPDLDVECRIHAPLPEGNPYVASVQKLASRDARVRLMGGFLPADTGRVLRDLDLLAAPALWHENEPLLVKAALHLGVPILASRIGSLADMIDEGRNGWLAPPDDPGAWAQALHAWMKQPRRHFPPTPMKSMDENVCEILAIYEGLKGVAPCVRKCI